MARQIADMTTTRSDAEAAERIGPYLVSQGFTRTGSRKKNVWKKGLYWRIFASSRVEGGVAHLEVWNHLPYPGMGSFLMYFKNRGKLPEILEALQQIVGGTEAAPGRPVAAASGKAELKYAGFWRRLAAMLIDALLLYVVLGIVIVAATSMARGAAASGQGGRAAEFLVSNIVAAVAVVLAWIYFAIFESSPSQGTLGKKALGLRVTDLQGERISFGRATGRFWSKIVSVLVAGIGFLVAAFTGRKQALHDFMASTLVVRKY